MRVVVIDDFEEFADMAAAPLRRAGHTVLIATAPVDFGSVLAFRPDVIAIGIFRQDVAFDRPIRDFEQDVLGAKPIRELEGYPAITAVPIAIAATGLHEQDVPTTLRYDLFLTLPRDIKAYVPRLEALARQPRRRQLSEYVCPNGACRSRLFQVGSGGQDLYCPRCGAGVAMTADGILYTLPENPERAIAAPLSAIDAPTAPFDGPRGEAPAVGTSYGSEDVAR
jgi:CheY-like chemotaxis protein